MEYDERVKFNIFQGATTHSNDYRTFSEAIGSTKRESLKWPPIKRESEKKTIPPREPYRLIDHETFKPYKLDAPVPFDLLWLPRPIVQTNPRIIPEKHYKSELDSSARTETVKNKPKLKVAPQICLEQVDDGPMKKLIIAQMYTTTLRMAQDEVAKYTRPIKRDIFETSLDRQDPLAFEVDRFPPLPREWRDLSSSWDRKQKRACVDPTKQFWLSRPLDKPKFYEIYALVSPETKRKISELIDREALRQPHDVMKPGYTGYQPRLAVGVPLEKTDFPVVHPELTWQQAMAKRMEG